MCLNGDTNNGWKHTGREAEAAEEEDVPEFMKEEKENEDEKEHDQQQSFVVNKGVVKAGSGTGSFFPPFFQQKTTLHVSNEVLWPDGGTDGQRVRKKEKESGRWREEGEGQMRQIERHRDGQRDTEQETDRGAERQRDKQRETSTKKRC